MPRERKRNCCTRKETESVLNYRPVALTAWFVNYWEGYLESKQMSTTGQTIQEDGSFVIEMPRGISIVPHMRLKKGGGGQSSRRG